MNDTSKKDRPNADEEKHKEVLITNEAVVERPRSCTVW